MLAATLALAWVSSTRVKTPRDVPAPPAVVSDEMERLPFLPGKTALRGTWPECLSQAAMRLGLTVDGRELSGQLARGQPAGIVGIELTDVSGRALLLAVAGAGGAEHVYVRDGVIRFSLPEGPYQARAYDVRDLLDRGRAFSRLVEPLSDPSPSPNPHVAMTHERAEADLLQTAYDTVTDFADMAIAGDRLWISTNAAGHQRLREVLSLLRREGHR